MAVATSGKHKAAIVLKSLDTKLATKLLERLSPEELEEMAIAMAQIEASNINESKSHTKVVKEFCTALSVGQVGGISSSTLLNKTLVSILGNEKAEHIRASVKKTVGKKDVFGAVRSAKADELVLALQNESPHLIAMLLSDMEAKKAGETLSLLDKEISGKVVWIMTQPAQLGSQVKERVAAMVGEKLKRFKGEKVAEKPEEILRRLAIVLSDSAKDTRDEMLEEINTHDEQTATMVRTLMVTWDDILTIADRSLQEALRNVEPGRLAMALYGAEEEIAEKVRSNLSQRARSSVEEEAELMQDPLEEEILDAREEVVTPLRKANETGTLRRAKV